MDPEKLKPDNIDQLNVGESKKLLDDWLANKVIKDSVVVVDLEAASDMAAEGLREGLGAVALDPTGSGLYSTGKRPFLLNLESHKPL